jgi:hypothetical protein
MTALDQWTLDQFRAMTRTKSTMMITRPTLKGFGSDDPARDRLIRRSLFAMLLSHDIHYGPAYGREHEVPDPERLELQLKLRALVDLPNAFRCLFAGYWQTGEAVWPSHSGVRASIYRNIDLGRAAVLLFNTDGADRACGGTRLDLDRILPVRGKRLRLGRIYDLETGRDVDVDFEAGHFVVKDQLLVKSHDFRMLAVEAGQ